MKSWANDNPYSILLCTQTFAPDTHSNTAPQSSEFDTGQESEFPGFAIIQMSVDLHVCDPLV